MKKIEDKIWWAMCDAHMSQPVKLRDADITKPFIYDRRWGLFYVPFGYHEFAMGTLYSINNGETNRIDMAEKIGRPYELSTLADLWLEEHGTAYMSGVAKIITAWSFENLNRQEHDVFGDSIWYIV